MALYANIVTYPPLNQISILPHTASNIDFTALLFTHRDRPQYPFLVRLYYSPNSTASRPPSQWPSIKLKEAEGEAEQHVAFVRTEAEKAEEHRRAYQGSLQLENPGRLKFAVAYKIDEYAGWRWVESVGGINTGELLVSAPAKQVSVESVCSLLDTRDGWTVKSCSSDGAAVFEVTNEEKIASVEDGTRAFGSKLPGKVLGKVQKQVRYMSLVRLEPYWLGVQHSTSGDGCTFYDQSMDGILVCFLLESGQTLGLLAYGGEDVYTVIRCGGEGEVVVGARNDSGKEVRYSLLVAVAGNHESVIKAVMTEARKRATEGAQMQKLLNRVEEFGNRGSWAGEAWFDGLAYCTWNGLDMHNCDEKAVLGGLETLDKNGVKIETFLLDDCWQSLGPQKIREPGSQLAGWDKFETNDNFPRGLKPLIDDIRAKHKNIKSFGVWHALLGYWSGICASGYIVDNYKTRRVRTVTIGNVPSNILIIDPSDVDRFYDDLYAWLKAQGVDFVKTDVQHMLSMLEDAKDREEVPMAYQRAWTTAVCKHFQGKAISCMSQTQQTMFHSLLQDKTPKVMHRNSDDFFPDITDSNPWHIFVNAHNALLDRHLNVIPDWDMFQTSHAFSAYHAASRALSGGPILITDIPGAHDTALIATMTAHNPAGTLVALRPRPAAVSGPWSRYADGNLCRIGTYAGEGKEAIGMLGLFSVCEGEAREVVSVAEFSGVQGERIVLSSQRTGQVLGPLVRSQGLVSVNLKGRGWDILTAAPVHEEGGMHVAVLGLVGLVSGPAAVARYAVEGLEEGVKLRVVLKALGRLGVWIGGGNWGVRTALVDGREIVGYVDGWRQGGGVVHEINVLRYWQENGLWSDAVEVEVELLVTELDFEGQSEA